jgi:hypothetical protein
LVLKKPITQQDLVMDARVVHFYLTENMVQKIVQDAQ